ncbi:UPF0489 family protein [Paraburkholderia sp. C35]|uniref:UPF0489 family protein n=1 Tax=Paraburkholderia sp. C35 TaxID=2126993 RepID=UPI000D6999F4|nr:UPF0489 family protein [Paraburkholderia sp. C35]
MAQQQLKIAGKDVYIVEKHHHVLQGWAEVRRNNPAIVPALITLDHHTDLEAPFDDHRYWTVHPHGGDRNTAATDALLPGMIKAIDWKVEATVMAAIDDLKHDEHIRTAVQAKILSRAFVVNLQTDNIADAEVYGTYGGCDAIDCKKPIHNDRCVRARYDGVLESTYLDHELATLTRMAQADGVLGPEAEPYILDIDLDYFHTEKAIEPDDPTTFYRLVQNALAITIATEPECVRELRLGRSKITADSLLDRMQQHIVTAMT